MVMGSLDSTMELDITILTHEQIWSMRVKIFDGLNKVVIQL
jgi:hypothetical protein